METVVKKASQKASSFWEGNGSGCITYGVGVIDARVCKVGVGAFMPRR